MVSSPPPRSSRSAGGALWYVTEGTAHDGSDKPRNWFVGSFDCTVENADAEWAAVRRRFSKDGVVQKETGVFEGEFVQAQHILLSFDRSEYDPDRIEDIERAWRQGMETTDRLRAGHQAVCSVQTDGESGLVHCDVLISAVHPETGVSINGRHPARDINQMRRIVNQVAAEYGFDNERLMAERRSQKLSANELARRNAGEYVPKVDLFERLDRAAEGATTRDQFVEAAAKQGVEYRFRGKSGSSAAFTDATGTGRKFRGRDLGSQWMAKGVDVQLQANLVVQQEQARLEQLEAAEREAQVAQREVEAAERAQQEQARRTAIAAEQARIKEAEDSFWTTRVEVDQPTESDQQKSPVIHGDDFWTTGVKLPEQRPRARELSVEPSTSDDYEMEL